MAERTWNRLAKTLKLRRLEKGLSQEHVAKLLGYKNAQMFSNIERGKSGLPPHNIKKASEVLDLPKEKIVNVMVEDYKELLFNEASSPSMHYKTSKKAYV